MSTISSVSAVSGPPAAASSNQPTIEQLQQQMLLYPEFAAGSGPGAAAYKALQYAIETNNVSGAQTALAGLHRATVPVSPPSTATKNSDSPLDRDADHDGSSGQTPAASENSLNVTA